MGPMASQITSLTIVYSTIYLGADNKNQSSASLAFVRGIHRWQVYSPQKEPVTRKIWNSDQWFTLCIILGMRYISNIYHNTELWFDTWTTYTAL